jgi:hypothetical protein
MRNFFHICDGLDVSGLLREIAQQPELWNAFPVRTEHPLSAHRIVDDIVLRYSPFRSGEDFVDKVCSRTEVMDYPPWYKLPSAHPFVYGLMTRLAAVHLGRVMITRVAPGISIPPHSDRIPPAEEAFPDRIPPAVYYDRYHIVLQSAPGVVFRCGDESVYMPAGSAWWFNNQIEHEVVNNSAADRIHLIIDARVAHDNYDPRELHA